MDVLTDSAFAELGAKILNAFGIEKLQPFTATGVTKAYRVPLERRSTDGMFRTSENWLCTFIACDRLLEPAPWKPLIDAAIAADVEHLLVLTLANLADDTKAAIRQALAPENVRVVFLDGDLARLLAADHADRAEAPNAENLFSFTRLRSSTRARVEAEPWLKRFQTSSMQPMRVLPLSAKDAALEEADLFRALSGGSFLILGEPGAGKTTSMLALAKELAASGPYTPVFVPLGRYQGSFWDLLCEALSPGAVPVPKQVAQSLLASGILVLLLDGLNEVQNPDLQTQLVRELNNLTDPEEPTALSRWVISGRVHDYQQSHNVLNHLESRRWELQRLTADLIYRFLASAIGDVRAKVLYESLGESVHELCANPLLLNMLLTIYREKGSTPSSRSALYRQFLDLLMRWGDDRGLGASERDAMTNLLGGTVSEQTYRAMADESLTTLAASMVTTMVHYGEARQVVSSALKATRTPDHAATLIIEDLTRRGILVRDVFNRISFVHHTFQEYFQARTLIRKQPSDIIPDAGAPASRYESIVFLAGMLDDPTPLIRRAITTDLALGTSLLLDAPESVPLDVVRQLAEGLWDKVQTGGVALGKHRRDAQLFQRIAALAAETPESMLVSMRPQASRMKNTSQLFWFYAVLGDAESQSRVLSQAAKDADVPADLLFEAAVTAHDDRDYARAVELYTKYIADINPHSASAFHNRGVALASMGEREEALADYSRAVELETGSPVFRCSLGSCLYDLGRQEDALREVTAAVDEEPAYDFAHHLLATWLESKDPVKALRHREQSVRFARHDDQLRQYLPALVDLQEKLDYQSSAIRSLKRMIALDPTSTKVTEWKERIARLRQALDAAERKRSARERLQERGELPLPTLALEWLRASGLSVRSPTSTWLLAEGGRGLPARLAVALMGEPVVTALSLRTVIDSIPTQARPDSQVVIVSAAEILAIEARHQLAALQDQYKVALVTALEIRDALLQSDRECRLLLERALQRAGQSDNPFDYKGVVREQTEFFGRIAEIEELAVKLGRGQQVGLYGIHKIGKSSLLEQIRRKLHLSNPEMTVVSVEMNDSLNDAGDLYKEILEKLPGFSDLSADRYISSSLFREQLVAYHKQRDRARPGHRILLLLDEYAYLIPDRRGRHGLKGFLEVLGLFKALHQEGWFTLVACGRTADLNRQASWGNDENPFLDLVHARFLGPLPREEASAMMQTLARRGRLTFSPEALDAVYEESGGHPAFSRALGSEIVRDGPGTVTADRVCSAVDRFLADRDQRAILTAIYEKRLDEDEQRLARTLALRGPQPRQALFTSSDTAERRLIRDSLGNLIDTFVLVERSDGLVGHRYGLLRRVIQMEARELGYEA